MGGYPMEPVTTAELLDFWEKGMDKPLIQKAIDLLSIVYPAMDASEISRLNIGERDARLLVLYEWLFGSTLNNIAVCPLCSEQVEWETDIREIMLQMPEHQEPTEDHLFNSDGYTILFRLPDSNDLSFLLTDDKKNSAPEELLKRIIIECKYRGKRINFSDLPSGIVSGLELCIEGKIPQADISMRVSCVNCNHRWDIQFDIISYLWIRINNWAVSLLKDLSLLAHAYGWSERDILNMSPARRKIYLEMINT